LWLLQLITALGGFGSETSTKSRAIPSQGRERELQLEKLVDVKRQAVEEARRKLTIGNETYIIKEKVDKIVSAIIFAKDFITAAASLEPHAALAWAGVSVLLPVSLVDSHTILTLSTNGLYSCS
jgi:N-terminal domain of NWD NACHT-NTPase